MLDHRTLALAAGLLLLAPTGASAQVHWDSPFNLGPGVVSGLAVQLVDPDPGDGVGAMVSWRRSPVPGGPGFRVGVAEGFRDDVAVFGGVDVSGALMARDEEFPVDLIWAAGAGGSVGDHALLSFPAGLFVGRTFTGDEIRFVPYAGPRLDLDAHLGRETPLGGDDDEVDLALSADLGLDLVFSERLTVRFGGSVGDHEALSIGVVFPELQ